MAKIIGDIVGVPNPQSDLLQNDSTKADFVKNKHIFARAIRGNASGTSIVLDDVSSMEHPLDVTVENKNIIPYPYAGGMSKEHNGITFTVNNDKSITVNGTATANARFALIASSKPMLIGKGKSVKLKGCPKGGFTNTYMLQMQAVENGSYLEPKHDVGMGVTFTTNYEYYYVQIVISANCTVDNLVFKPELTYDSDLSRVTVKYADFLDSKTPLSVTANADGTVTGIVPMSPNMALWVEQTDPPVIINLSYNKDTSIVIAKLEEQQKSTIESLADMLTDTIEIDVSKYNNQKFTINANGNYLKADVVRSAVIPLADNVTAIDIIGNYQRKGIFALLTDIGGEKPSFSSYNAGRVQMSEGQSVHIEKPSDAKYLYLYTVGGSGEPFTPQSVKFSVLGGFGYEPENKDIKEIKQALFNMSAMTQGSGGRDIPQNRGVLNAYKKAHQLLDVEWTALADIPSDTALAPIEPKTHKGLPYSSVKELCKFVPFFVSLRTFMTAAHNPYSLLYTEDVSAEGSRSAYGFEYHGVNGVATYYGMVCSLFVLSALGFKEYYSTYELEYLCKKGILEKVYDQSGYGVQLMDIVFYRGHGMLITDIYRDERGVPTRIFVSESGGDSPWKGTDRGLASGTTEFTLEGFNEYLAEKKAQKLAPTIYRYTELYKNLDYEPSPFVAVEDEMLSGEYEYNDDICTFAGDYAAFREGEPIYINYTKGSYTSMELYKNDSLLDTITLDTSPDVHAVNLGSNLTYGKYKARLTDGTNHSDYTYFEVIETNVEWEYNDGDFKLEFSSNNSKPIYAQFCFRDGTSRGVYVFTDTDLDNGVAYFNALDILKDMYGKEAFDDTTYIRVFFKGEYGTVCNDYTVNPFYIAEAVSAL